MGACFHKVTHRPPSLSASASPPSTENSQQILHLPEYYYTTIMLLRAVQVMTSSSSGVLSSPLQRFKPLTPARAAVSFLSTPLTPSSSKGPTPHGATTCRSFRLSAVRSEATKSDNMSSPAFQPPKVQFCQWCGAATRQEIPEGEEKPRAICTSCGKITYQNPKMVTGCLVEHDDKVLLCKRKIPPSYGLWTLPAGYMELGESAVEGATRETWEEAGAEVEVLSPFAQLDIPLIGQTYIIFRARMRTPHFAPGPESIECRLFALEDIPFDSLAFSSMLVTLKLYVEDLKAGKPKFHYGTINKRPGTGPSDIHSYNLDDHFCC